MDLTRAQIGKLGAVERSGERATTAAEDRGVPASSLGVYAISVAAELAGSGVQALRLYERRGLLTPDRSEGGTRRYSAEDVEVARRIGAAQFILEALTKHAAAQGFATMSLVAVNASGGVNHSSAVDRLKRRLW